MKPINVQNVKIKNLIGIIEEPTIEDLLFEIVQFLDNQHRYDGEFKTREVSLYTKVRVNKDLAEDLHQLVDKGYLEKGKYSSYKVVKHLWEK